jgi:hypothetical protein
LRIIDYIESLKTIKTIILKDKPQRSLERGIRKQNLITFRKRDSHVEKNILHIYRQGVGIALSL